MTVLCLAASYLQGRDSWPAAAAMEPPSAGSRAGRVGDPGARLPAVPSGFPTCAARPGPHTWASVSLPSRHVCGYIGCS